MLNSTVLEVVIGLSFAYAGIALIASSIYEAVSSMLKLRANTLLDGIKAMLNDQKFEGLARTLYQHALINPRSDGEANREARLDFKPSYIDSKHFAVALIDSIQQVSGDFASLGKTIDMITDPQLKTLLQGFYARANGSLEEFQNAIASWFDMSMERVSGGYKRNAQLFTFVIALICAGLLNVDSFHLFSVLWRHPSLVANVSAGVVDAAQMAQRLNELPVGWQYELSRWAPLGWLVTASSALFGAPFWFDVLRRLTNLRGTGPKPSETTH